MFTKTGWIYTRIWLFVQDIENDVYYEYVFFIRWCIFYKVIILLRFRICRMGSRGYYLFTALKHSLRRVQIRFDGSDWGWMVVHTIWFYISDAVCLFWKGGEWNGSAQTRDDWLFNVNNIFKASKDIVDFFSSCRIEVEQVLFAFDFSDWQIRSVVGKPFWRYSHDPILKSEQNRICQIESCQNSGLS